MGVRARQTVAGSAGARFDIGFDRLTRPESPIYALAEGGPEVCSCDGAHEGLSDRDAGLQPFHCIERSPGAPF